MHPIIFTLVIICSFLFPGTQLNAQEAIASPKDALEYFNNGQYDQALPLYKALLDRYNREPRYNYYYGVCLLEQKEKNDEAIKRLSFATLKNVNRDAFFYLGRAYQNGYEFEEAIKAFSRFLKITHAEDPRRESAQRAIDDCNTAIHLINKYFQICVLSKDTVLKEEVLSKYHLSDQNGTLSPNRSFFKTGVDPEQIMYKTERENEVLFVVEQPDSGRYNINKMVRLLDSWSKAQDLGAPINTSYDERYPFMLVDGVTFYFSSDRPGGMGGMDIYQAFFDPETGTFSEPENLGPPFNSPANDYLFAADGFENQAWFTTDRGVNPGKAVVVKIKWDKSVIKNLARDTEQIKQLAQLPLNESDSTLDDYAGKKGAQNGEMKPKNEFKFFINDTLFYTRFEHFLSAEALNEFKKGFDLNLKKDSLDRLMNQKRKIYSHSYNKDELKQLIDVILQLENEVYGLNDQVQDHYLKARRLELTKILELKSKGIYHQDQGIKTVTPPQKTHTTLKPNDFQFYSQEEFQGPEKATKAMYHHFFGPEKVQALEQADSLYAWANLLKLEAAKLLEESSQTEKTESTNSLLEKLKNSTETAETPEPNDASVAKEKAKKALDIYHEALDKKYRIYHQKFIQLIELPQNAPLKDSLASIRAYYDEATEGMARMYTYNQERYETLGGLKRKAVALMEQTLLNKARQKSESQTGEQLVSRTGKRPPASMMKEEIADAVAIEAPPEATLSPKKIVATAFNNTPKPVYKIQIGVFSHAPRPEALSKIPPVSTTPVKGKNLTKYFSGQWDSFNEAQQQVAFIREAGFEGAFVVAFKDELQISIEDAKAWSDKKQ